MKMRVKSRPKVRSMIMEEAYKVVVDRLKREQGSIYDLSDFKLSEWFGNGWFVRFTCRAKDDPEFSIHHLAFFADKNGDLEMTGMIT